MNPFTSFLMIFVVISLVSVVGGWVFTDVDYNKLRKTLADGNDEFNNDLTDEELRQLKFSLIYPGTKWCGPGNIADNYDDLGTAVDTDMCCRTHDNCPDLMEAGEKKNNLTNTAFYTRLSCECDETFRKCLRTVNSSISTQVGTVYFNALGTKCFRSDYPVTSCKKYGGWFNKKCLEYIFDFEGEQLFQWFDVPNY